MATVRDIVPDSVLLKIADRIARSARGFARKNSTRIPKAIKVGRVHATAGTATINITIDTGIAPQALHMEYGTDPHTITAVNAPFLVFEGTNQYEGILIQIDQVSHPGAQAKPYIKPAKERHREQNLKDLREAVGRNMRLQIRRVHI